MHRRIAIPLLVLAALTMIGCQAKFTINEFDCKLDEGTVWHDVYLTNKSGKSLHEVKMTLTLIGEDGKPRSEDRYFVQWSDGQTLNVSLSSSNSPRNVQKISLTGSCTEGEFNLAWPNPVRMNSNTRSGSLS